MIKLIVAYFLNQSTDLKFNLDDQKVKAKENSDEREDITRDTKRKQQELEGQVGKLHKDLENANN